MALSEAVGVLNGMISEYDFLTPADKSRALSAVLSPALRYGELLRTHFPVFVFEADKPQAGKGLFAALIQKIYGEAPAIVSIRKGVGGFDEEFSQALLSGLPFIQFDNIKGHLESQFLEMALTVEFGCTIGARILYRNTIDVDPNRAVLHLTSNSVETSRDFAYRACFIRIRKRPGYAFRRFKEGDLLEHIAANQPLYLARSSGLSLLGTPPANRAPMTPAVKAASVHGPNTSIGLFKKFSNCPP